MAVEAVGQSTPAVVTESAWPVLVVALIARHDVNGIERIAIDSNNTAVSLFPSKYVDQNKILDWAAICQIFGLPSDTIVSQRVVHIEHDSQHLQGTLRLYWYVNVAPGRQSPSFCDKVDWVRIEKISRRLTDHRDLFALAAASASRELQSPPIPQNWPKFILASADRIRLRGELRRTQIQLSVYQTQCPLDRNYRASLLSLSKGFLALKERDYEGAWKCLADAERHELFIMSEEQLAAKRVIFEETAETKLNGWRAEAFDRLMKKASGRNSAVTLAAAHYLITDSQETKFYNIHLLRRQTNLMAIILLFLSILFLFLAGQIPDILKLLTSDINSANSGTIILLELFILGGVGAAVSALIEFAHPHQALRVPDRLMNSIITVVRPAIGGACALIGCFFVLSGVISGIFQKNQITGAFLFCSAFAFGFSERLVISTVSKFDPK